MSYIRNHTNQPIITKAPINSPYSYRTTSAPVNIRPLNVATLTTIQSGFGKARPLKHFRKGRYIANNQSHPQYIASSKPNIHLYPGEVSTYDYSTAQLPYCSNGIDSYVPTTSYTDNPQNPPISCIAPHTPRLFNAEKKARMRSRGATTILSHNYYNSSTQYLQNRTNTYYQNTFHYNRGNGITQGQSVSCNQFCNNTSRNYYHPNNTKYSQDGAVQSSLNTLNKNLVVINKSLSNEQEKTYPSTIFVPCGKTNCKKIPNYA